jgi:hypothetical protein
MNRVPILAYLAPFPRTTYTEKSILEQAKQLGGRMITLPSR